MTFNRMAVPETFLIEDLILALCNISGMLGWVLSDETSPDMQMLGLERLDRHIALLTERAQGLLHSTGTDDRADGLADGVAEIASRNADRVDDQRDPSGAETSGAEVTGMARIGQATAKDGPVASSSESDQQDDDAEWRAFVLGARRSPGADISEAPADGAENAGPPVPLPMPRATATEAGFSDGAGGQPVDALPVFRTRRGTGAA